MNLVKRFLCDSRDQWWRLAILTLALILAASFEIIAPRLLGNIVDAIVHGIEQQQDWHRGQKLDLADYFRTKRGDPDTAADIESHLDWPIWPATTQEETAA